MATLETRIERIENRLDSMTHRIEDVAAAENVTRAMIHEMLKKLQAGQAEMKATLATLSPNSSGYAKTSAICAAMICGGRECRRRWMCVWTD